MAYFGRSKNKIQEPYNLSDMYSGYIDSLNSKDKYAVRRQDFIKIAGDFNKRIVDGILGGQVFVMPKKLGWIFIQKWKPKKIRGYFQFIDWKTSVEKSKQIYHENPHTDGYRYKVRWQTKNSGSTRGATNYYFKATRTFSRALAKILKSAINDYYTRVYIEQKGTEK